MRVIAFNSARVTVLFPLEEVSPLDGTAGQTTIDDIALRYQFAKKPDLTLPREELQKLGLKFENGRYKRNNQIVTIGSFTIFTDGVVIDAVNSDDAEDFWNDACEWLLTHHRFRDFSTTPRRKFVSQVVVEFEKPLSGLLYQFDLITRIVSESSKRDLQHPSASGASQDRPRVR